MFLEMNIDNKNKIMYFERIKKNGYSHFFCLFRKEVKLSFKTYDFMEICENLSIHIL